MRTADLVGESRWFGGVHVFDRGRVLLTVGGESPEIAGPPGPRAHVRWIGGGPHAGESYLECGLREAEEELGCACEPEHSERTLVELRPDPPEWLELEDRPAPLLVQRYEDGEVLVMFRARPLGEPRPTDVERLAWVPHDAIEALVGGVAPADAPTLGMELVGPPLEADRLLFLGRLGAEYLLSRFGVDEIRP